MAVCLPEDESLDKVTEHISGLCYSASRGDVHKLRSYMHQEGIMLSDRSGAGALVLATEQGNVKAITTLLAAGVDVNMSQCDQKIQTPLMAAAERGHVDCLITLIDGGAKINALRDDGQTALAIAISEGCSDDVKNVIDATIQVKIRPFMGSLVMTGNTSWKEQHEECAVLLVQAGADIGYTDDSGYSLLMYSAANGCIKTVKSFIQAGADINQTAIDGSTALQLACRCTSLLDYRLYKECVGVLLEAGATADAINLDGETALMLAVINSSHYKKKFCRTEIIQSLLQAGANLNIQDKNGKTALMYAAERNLTNICKILMKHSADISIQDSSGKTAYMYVTDNRCLEVLIKEDILSQPKPKKKFMGINICTDGVCITDNRYLEEFLLEDNVSKPYNEIIIQDCDGKTVCRYIGDYLGVENLISKVTLTRDMAFICEAERNASRMVNFICEAEKHERPAVNLNIRDKEGRTALIHAAMGNLAVNCGILLQHFGGNINTQDNEGRTALMYATESNCVLSLLMGENKCNSCHADLQPQLDMKDHNGKNALMHLAEHNLHHIYFRLLRNPSPSTYADSRDNQGKTALMYASESAALSELLSEWRADPNLADSSGCSVLVHLLKRQKSYSSLVEAVTVVLEYGANPVLDLCYHHLLYLGSHSTTTESLMQTLAAEGRREVIHLLVCNGFVTHMELQGSTHASYQSPVCLALKARRIDIAKYFIACCCLSESDLRSIRTLASTATNVQGPDSSRVNKISDEVRSFVQQVVSQPWPLVKLAFITVSSALGSYPKRNENIAQTQLPARLQRMLRFQEPISLLPVSEWSNIPLCFDPSEFEKLPRPRPLLYHWPIGTDMVTNMHAVEHWVRRRVDQST